MSPVTKPNPIQPKKNVTSKIASLWKKVEDSKMKTKAEESSKKYKPKDRRVWLGGGGSKAASEEKETAPAPGKLIRSGTYEKLSENGTEEVEVEPVTKPPRSRSRLSMKLSKFSLKRRPSSGPVTPSLEDQVNGNTPGSEEPLTLSPDLERPESSADSMSTGPDETASTRPPLQHLSNRSPASAIVAPFNYKPHPAAAAAVKRNTSYVSSIGRRREEEPSSSDDDKKKAYSAGQQTSSAMVTLV